MKRRITDLKHSYIMLTTDLLSPKFSIV